jgi:chromosome segregation ATPase
MNISRPNHRDTRSHLFQDVLFNDERREALAVYEALQAAADSPESTDNQGLAAQTLNLIDALLAHISEATDRQQETDADFANLSDALNNAQEQLKETRDELDTAEDLLEHANSRIKSLQEELTSLTAFKPF